jgi:hypothetical protein
MNKKTLATLSALVALGSFSASAITVLDFEGLQDNEPVANYYNGGLGGSGSGPGPNFGVTFTGGALALIDGDAGGSGNFGGEPSPDTVLYFLNASAIMNYAAGFDTGFSFFYTAINNPGLVTVWDGPNATGNVLAQLVLPLTPYNGAPDPTGQFSPLLPIGVAFAGTALSVDFGGTGNQIAYDNITFGSETPQGVPDGGASALLLGVGLLGLGGLRRITR